uniref:formin-2-like n=1 Tax=Panthera onca TaxID=9690 RepID=UPI002952DD29
SLCLPRDSGDLEAPVPSRPGALPASLTASPLLHAHWASFQKGPEGWHRASRGRLTGGSETLPSASPQPPLRGHLSALAAGLGLALVPSPLPTHSGSSFRPKFKVASWAPLGSGTGLLVGGGGGGCLPGAVTLRKPGDAPGDLLPEGARLGGRSGPAPGPSGGVWGEPGPPSCISVCPPLAPGSSVPLPPPHPPPTCSFGAAFELPAHPRCRLSARTSDLRGPGGAHRPLPVLPGAAPRPPRVTSEGHPRSCGAWGCPPLSSLTGPPTSALGARSLGVGTLAVLLSPEAKEEEEEASPRAGSHFTHGLYGRRRDQWLCKCPPRSTA